MRDKDKYNLQTVHVTIISLAVSMNIFRLLLKRRRLALLGTTFSGTLAGFVIVSRILPGNGASRCLATCTSDSPTYQYLQGKEAVVKFDHPRISSVYMNYLPSNNPNEDRHVAGGWSHACAGLFGVIDGHKSDHCSENLKNVLLKHVTSVFLDEGVIQNNRLNEYNLSKLDSKVEVSLRTPQCELKESDVEEALKKSFTSLDNKVSEDALKCVRMISKGRSIKENGMLETIMKALAGACALLSIVSTDKIHIASTGDCRAVLGKAEGVLGEWSPLPLSVDQNAHNELEVSRLKEAHPGEENTVVFADRLLGGLMPFRSFGDIDYKWSAKDIQVITNEPPNYKTPPYLTAEPVVTTHILDGNEKFLVLATDGLWEKLPNDKVVNVVGDSLYANTSRNTGFSSFFWRDPEQCCKSVNPATRLIWEALGGKEEIVEKMLNIPTQYSRMYRDDITVIVIEFK